MQILDSVVFITGGASGIGAAMARAFAAAGARAVVVADIDGEGALAVAREVDGRAVTLDVTDEDATAQAIRAVEQEFGSLDILCTNAGIATGGSVDVADAQWQRTWEVNVMAHVYAVRHAIGGMLARGEGHIVSTSSAAGLLTSLGAAPYSVTKHAAVALAEWLAITYGDRGIGVSCLCPQFVDTPMLDAFAGGSEAVRTWVDGIAIAPEDVAASVIEAVESGAFLILPHPEVAEYFAGKANDYDRWIAGMRRLQASLDASG